MGLLERMMARAMPQVDRRIDWRVDRKVEERVLPHLTRPTEAVSELSGSLAEASEKLLFTMSELRRWMIDDFEASTETTMLLGETLTRLQASVERVESELGSVTERLARIESALADRDRAGSAVPGS